MALTLTLLGGFHAALGGQPVQNFPTQKVRALLAYLALESDKPQPRGRLCGLLWPDLPEEAAQNNLRKSLHRLHKALEHHDPSLSDRLFVITRKTVELNRDFFSTDVAAFEALLGQCEIHPHRHLHTCATCLEVLNNAVTLYSGELLDGLELVDAPPFEEWLLLKRSSLQTMALTALEGLASAYEKRGDDAWALGYVVRQLVLNPYLESAHRQRMQLLARSGQETEALKHYQAWQRLLSEEMGLEPEAATVALYEALKSGAASLRPAEPSPMHGFPAQPTPCLGREQELLELTELLLDPDCRLLTLLGPGGIGKTRLATALADVLAAKGEFPDGLYFFPLAQITALELMWSALASGLGLDLREGDDAKAQVLAYLKTRACLLVLDNVEWLLEAATHLADIVAAAPAVRLLFTSRVPLNLRAEHRFLLEGLGYPKECDVPDPLAYSAVQLFVEAARRVQPGFRLSSQDAKDVIGICRSVVGLPLGLELAATWTRMLDCRTIAGEIEKNLDFLKGSLADMPERHRSMAAVFAYSWELLPPASQRLLAQISVFAGPFGLEAGLEVTGASVLALATLLDHSLLKRTADGHYEMHELLRQFASERLEAVPSLAEEVKAGHGVYYLKLVATQAPLLHGSAARQAAAVMQRQLGNVRKACAWALAHHSMELLESSLEGLALFYDFTGLFEEAAALLDSVIALERQMAADVAASTLLSHLLVWQAHFLNRRGQTEAAIAAAREALALAEHQGNHERQAKAHNLLGELLLFRGDYSQARVHQQEALAFYEGQGGSQLLADALSRMGMISWRTGNYAAAMSVFERALSLQKELGDETGRAQVLSAMAGIHWERGELEQAQTYLQQATKLYEMLDHKMGKAYSVGRLGILHHHQGRYDAALECNSVALQLFTELVYEEGLAHFLGNRGSVYQDLGDFDQALACHQQAFEHDKRLGHAGDMGRHLSNIGSVLKAKGHLAEALTYFEQALPRLREPGSSRFILGPLLGKTEVLFIQRQYEEAKELAKEAHELAREVGNEDLILEAQVLLVKIIYASGSKEAAISQLQALLAASTVPKAQALLHYELWHMEQGEAHRQVALMLYRDLFGRIPSHLHKTRLEELDVH